MQGYSDILKWTAGVDENAPASGSESTCAEPEQAAWRVKGLELSIWPDQQYFGSLLKGQRTSRSGLNPKL